MILYRKSMILVIIIILAPTLLTGCWNRKELNHIAIQLATAIDKVGDEYRVATQVVIPGEVSKHENSNNISPVTLFHAQAPTILEAFRKLTLSSPRKIYSAHIRLVIIGESLAKQGISEVLDIFNRNPETRKDFYIAISKKNEAKDVLEVITSLERIPADNFYHMVETSRKNWTISNAVTIDELVEELVSEGVNPVLPVLKLYGGLDEGKKITNAQEVQPNAYVKLEGMAVFNNDKLAGWFNEEQSKGYNFIRNNIRNSAGHITCPGEGLIGIETLRNQTKINVGFAEGKPVVTIKIKNVSIVSDVQCTLDVSSPETINEIKEKAAERIKGIIERTIHHAQRKYQFDVFGFGQLFYLEHPKTWTKMKEDWSTYYWPNLEVDYDIEVQIHKIGTTRSSVKDNLRF